jgi:hypothetical protein
MAHRLLHTPSVTRDMKRVVFLVCCLLLACQRPRSASAQTCREHEPPRACPPPSSGIGGHQGTYLEGNGLERFHFALPGGTFPPAPGARLATAASCGTDQRPVIVVQSCRPSPGLVAVMQGVVSCVVDVEASPGICTTKGPFTTLLDPSPTRHRGVTMVRGFWDHRGTWRDDPGLVTLSCDAAGNEPNVEQFVDADGAITKCAKQFQIDPATHSDAFQACVRMIRADYCGDGRVHTHKLTEISVATPQHPMTVAECSDGQCFEASWSKNGAVCIARPRWEGPDMGFDDCRQQFVQVGDMLCRGNPADGVVFSRSRQFVCGKPPRACGADADPVCTGSGAPPPTGSASPR